MTPNFASSFGLSDGRTHLFLSGSEPRPAQHMHMPSDHAAHCTTVACDDNAPSALEDATWSSTDATVLVPDKAEEAVDDEGECR